MKYIENDPNLQRGLPESQYIIAKINYFLMKIGIGHILHLPFLIFTEENPTSTLPTTLQALSPILQFFLACKKCYY